MTGLGKQLALVVSALQRRGIEYAVIGGIANFVWGEVRGTRDLDFAVNVAGHTLDEFADLASQLGTPLLKDPVQFAERSRILPIRLPDGVVVDFMLATLPFEFDAIERAKTVEHEGVEVQVVTPEDLIVYKIVSQRPQDYLDIVGILRRQEDLEVGSLSKKIEAWAKDLGETEISERWNRAMKEAGR